MKSKELVNILKENGWSEELKKGIYYMQKDGKTVVFPCLYTKELFPSMLNCILQQTGLKYRKGIIIMEYFAKIIREEGVFTVSFPDVPSVNTYGETLDQALDMAYEALSGALEIDVQDGFELDQPTVYVGDEYYAIQVKPSISVAYDIKKMRGSKSQKEIAQAMNVAYQTYQRYENPESCNPKVSQLEKIAASMGKKVEIKFV